MAQLVVAAAGAAIGAPFGPMGAQLGWALGSMLATPKSRSTGPRLDDLKVTGTEYGQPIPFLAGHPRVSGQVVWSSDRRETAKTEEVGKGGGSEYTSYSYDIDMLVMVADCEMAGVSRVWSNGSLIWSFTGEEDASAFKRITFYGGAADQLPDPVYEAAVGPTNACAYRGRSCVFIEGLQLGSSGAIPNLTFEVFHSGEQGDESYHDTFTDGLDPYATINGNRAGFAVVATDFGNGILNQPRVSSTSGTDTLRRSITPITARTVRVKFIIGDTGTDDCAVLSLLSASLQERVGINPRREAGFDAQRRPSISFRGETPIPLGTSALPVGEWLELFVVIDQTTGRMRIQIKRVTDDGVLVDVDNGVFASTLDIGVIQFRQDTATAGLTSATTYADLRLIAANGGRIDEDTLRATVERLCTRAGMASTQFDASALASITRPVRSMAVSQVGATRQTLEMLAAAYFFDAYLTDKLYFVPRGGAVAATIPFDEFGASGAEGGDSDPLPIAFGNDLELPACIQVTYANVDLDYQTATETSDRIVSGQASAQSVQIAMGMTSTEAKASADAMSLDSLSALTTSEASVAINRTALVPTDVISAEAADGGTYRMRIAKRSESDGVLSLSLVLDDPSVLQSTGITSTDYSGAGFTLASAPATTMVTLDLPILRDADNSPGYYLAGRGASAAKWPGAVVYQSNNASDYTQVGSLIASAVVGSTVEALGAWTGGWVMDTINTVTVLTGAGQLSTTTRAILLADDTVNACAIGNEVVRFQTATLQSAGVYVLSGLLRGQRGTEWACGTHTPGDRFALLSATGVRRVSTQASEIGQAKHLKAVTLGRKLSTSQAIPFTDTGRALRPLAPVDLRASVNPASGVYSLNWKRRTRLSTRFTGTAGAVVPLGETSEAYEVELKNAGGTVLSVETTTAPAYSYSSARKVKTYEVAVRFPYELAGKLYGVPVNQSGGGFRLVEQTEAGAFSAQSPMLVHQVGGAAFDGSVAWVGGFHEAGDAPSYVTSGDLCRVDLTNLGAAPTVWNTPTATYISAVIFDGTNVWTLSGGDGTLRKHNPTTLAVLATYTTGLAMTAMAYAGGVIFVGGQGVSKVQAITASTGAVLWEATANSSLPRLVANGLVFCSGQTVRVLDAVTGAVVATHDDFGPLSYFMGRLGDEVAYIIQTPGNNSSGPVRLLSALTGELSRDVGSTNVSGIVGSAFGNLLGFGTTTNSYVDYKGLELQFDTDLTGHSITVYQMSEAVGRGYGATIQL